MIYAVIGAYVALAVTIGAWMYVRKMDRREHDKNDQSHVAALHEQFKRETAERVAATDALRGELGALNGAFAIATVKTGDRLKFLRDQIVNHLDCQHGDSKGARNKSWRIVSRYDALRHDFNRDVETNGIKE